MAKYLTIAKEGKGVYREKMSRFLAFAIPVSSVEEAKGHVAAYVNEYHDARHVCWAYMVGADRLTFMSNDNGEPSGTAGKPILGQINSFGVTNVVVIIVRYFGGIKLGTSGLIAAYREAARLALDDAGVVEGREMSTMDITFTYLSMNDVMRLLKSYSDDVKITAQEFDNTCRIHITLPLDLVPALSLRLDNLSGVSINQ